MNKNFEINKKSIYEFRLNSVKIFDRTGFILSIKKMKILNFRLCYEVLNRGVTNLKCFHDQLA